MSRLIEQPRRIGSVSAIGGGAVVPPAAPPPDVREHAESLLRGMDALTRRFAILEGVPLDVIDRYERLLVGAHTSNLLRLSRISDRVLLRAEEGAIEN